MGRSERWVQLMYQLPGTYGIFIEHYEHAGPSSPLLKSGLES